MTWVLFIGSYPYHLVDVQLSNAKLSFLLANTTSIVQPLDHGVMYSFKCHYRQMLVKRIIPGEVRRIGTCRVGMKSGRTRRSNPIESFPMLSDDLWRFFCISVYRIRLVSIELTRQKRSDPTD